MPAVHGFVAQRNMIPPWPCHRDTRDAILGVLYVTVLSLVLVALYWGTGRPPRWRRDKE
jgi:hypothetical protein